MNKRQESKAETAAQTAAAHSEGAPSAASESKTGPRVYCGPTVRGVVKQYTVFAGGIPKALSDFIGKHPAAKALLVPVEHFARTRQQLGNPASAEAILYHKIESEL